MAPKRRSLIKCSLIKYCFSAIGLHNQMFMQPD